MGEVLVEYDYKARSSDELSIKKGEIIKDVINISFGWSEGVLNDKRGMFPDNYVKSLDKDVVFRNKRDTNSSLRQCKVIFSYQPVHPDELSLNTGDTINIIGEDEEGWWRGVYNGKEGVFPSNFVEEIFPAKPKRQEVNNRDELPNIISDTRIPNLPPKPAKILCEVKYVYKAQNDDELNLKEGDIVTLINRELADPGWWEGELNGKVGVFPDNFVTIIKSKDEISSKEETKSSNDIPETTSKTTAIVSHRSSLEAKSDESKSTPPLIHKKPMLPKKKSPSSTSKGFLSSIVNRKSDGVDGIASSKSYHLKNDAKVEVKNGEKGLDEVERNPLLKDMRAGRAKPPVRRPPTSGVVKDKHSTSEMENAIVGSSEDEATPEMKAPVREWEKHKAPWLEEMKMNQAKRSSTSPVSEKNLNTKGLYPELDKSPSENNSIMSKSMPCPELTKTSPIEFNNSIENDSSETKKVSNPSVKFNSENIFRKQGIPKTTPIINNTNAITANSTMTTTATITPTTTSNLNKHKPQQQQNTPNINNEKLNEKLDDRGSGDFAQDVQGETIQLTVSQYNSMLDRIQRLEILVEKHSVALENAKAISDKQKRFDDSSVL